MKFNNLENLKASVKEAADAAKELATRGANKTEKLARKGAGKANEAAYSANELAHQGADVASRAAKIAGGTAKAIVGSAVETGKAVFNELKEEYFPEASEEDSVDSRDEVSDESDVEKPVVSKEEAATVEDAVETAGSRVDGMVAAASAEKSGIGKMRAVILQYPDAETSELLATGLWFIEGDDDAKTYARVIGLQKKVAKENI